MVTEALTPESNVQIVNWVEAISAFFTRHNARCKTRVTRLCRKAQRERAYEERSTRAKSCSALRLFAPFA